MTLHFLDCSCYLYTNESYNQLIKKPSPKYLLSEQDASHYFASPNVPSVAQAHQTRPAIPQRKNAQIHGIGTYYHRRGDVRSYKNGIRVCKIHGIGHNLSY